MDRYINVWMGVCTNRYMDGGYTNRCMNGWVYRQIYKCMDGWVYK